MTELFLRYQDSDSEQLIDLTKIDISLTYANADLDSLTGSNTKGSYSFEADVPATFENKKFFYFPELVLEESFDDEIELLARLEVNGTVILDGYARIKTIISKGSIVNYKIVLHEGNSSWISNIKDATLRDLNTASGLQPLDGWLDNFNHVYDRTEQYNSLFIDDDSFYCYPVIDFGKNINGNNLWTVEDRLPSFRVWKVFKEILKQAGYNVNSDFIDGDFFKSLWFTPEKFPERDKNEILPHKFRVGWSGGGFFLSNNGDDAYLDTQVKVPFNTASPEPYFNTGTSSVEDLGTVDCEFDCQFKGRMSFKWEYTFENKSLSNTSGKPEVDLILRFKRARGTIQVPITGGGFVTVPNTQELQRQDITIPSTPAANNIKYQGVFTTDSYDVEIGDKYYYTVELSTSGSNNQQISIHPDHNDFYNTVYQTFVEGSDLDVKNIIPDFKQKEFIQDIRTAFNLYFYTDEIAKEVIIYPRDEFYTATGLDWSDKIDTSRPIKISHLGSKLGKTVRFGYANDSNDKYVELKEDQLNDGDDWMSYEFTNTNKSAKDSTTKKALKLFAPTYMGYGIATAPAAVIPRIWDSDIDQQPEKRIKKWKSRLLYHSGETNARGGRENLPTGQYWNFEGDHLTYYPAFVTNYRAFGGLEHSNSLDWDNTDFNLGLFEKHYLNSLNTINTSRKYEVYLNLDSIDILNLNFRTPIYLSIEGDGSYFHLEQIVDYRPENRSSVKCILIKVVNPVPTTKVLQNETNFIEDEIDKTSEDPEPESDSVVCTEKVWVSTEANPTGEFVDVYVDVDTNKVNNYLKVKNDIEKVQTNI